MRFDIKVHLTIHYWLFLLCQITLLIAENKIWPQSVQCVPRSIAKQWIVPQLSIRINYNGTWSILIQWLIGLWWNDNLTLFKQWKAWFLFVISVITYTIDFAILGRRLRNCGTIHRLRNRVAHKYFDIFVHIT